MKLLRSMERTFKRNFLPVLEKFARRPTKHPTMLNFQAIQRILVIRAHDHLSEYVLSTPVLRALRQRFPNAHISLLVLPIAAEAAQNLQTINELIVMQERLSGWSMKSFRQFWRQLRRGFDLAVVLNTVSHSLTSDLLAHFSRSKAVLGSTYLRFPHCSRNFFYNMEAPYWEGTKHQTDRNLDIVRYIGADTPDRRAAMTLLPDELEAGKKFLRDAGTTEEELIVAIHIGAGMIRNRWHPESFAVVAAHLQKEYNARIVAIWSAHEENLAFHFLSSIDFRPIAAKGLKIRQLAGIIANCRLFIGNDAGIMHVAAATNTPVIAIYGSNDPEEWKPLGDHFFAVRAPSRQCDDVTAEQVIDLLRNVLGADVSARRDGEKDFDISDKVFKQYVKALNKPQK
jgi:heptosyltransferase-2